MPRKKRDADEGLINGGKQSDYQLDQRWLRDQIVGLQDQLVDLRDEIEKRDGVMDEKIDDNAAKINRMIWIVVGISGTVSAIMTVAGLDSFLGRRIPLVFLIAWPLVVVLSLSIVAAWISSQRARAIENKIDMRNAGIEAELKAVQKQIGEVRVLRDNQFDMSTTQFGIIRENQWMIMQAIGMKPPTTRPLDRQVDP